MAATRPGLPSCHESNWKPTSNDEYSVNMRFLLVIEQNDMSTCTINENVPENEERPESLTLWAH